MFLKPRTLGHNPETPSVCPRNSNISSAKQEGPGVLWHWCLLLLLRRLLRSDPEKQGTGIQAVEQTADQGPQAPRTQNSSANTKSVNAISTAFPLIVGCRQTKRKRTRSRRCSAGAKRASSSKGQLSASDYYAPQTSQLPQPPQPTGGCGWTQTSPVGESIEEA